MDLFHILLRSQVRNLVLAATMQTGKTFVFIENVDEILVHGASHREAEWRFSLSHQAFESEGCILEKFQ